MSLNSGESLLCVVHYPSNTGFAWNYIEGLYADVADALAAEGIRTFVSYPVIQEAPQTLRNSKAQAILLDGSLDGWTSIRSTLREIRRRNIRTIYFTDRGWWHWAFPLLRLAGVRRIVAHDHTSGDRTVPRGVKRLAKWFKARLPGMSADVTVCVSEYVARRQREVGMSRPSRVVRLLNGIDLPDLSAGPPPVPIEAMGGNRQTVVCVCRAAPEKGVNHLFRSFDSMLARWPSGEKRPLLVYVGNGPEFDALRRLRDSLPSREDIILTGYRNDATSFVAHATMCVVPSVWQEACPLGVLEPMSYAKPVVAAMVGGVPEQIDSNEVGEVVPPGDSDALATAIERMLQDLERRERIGQAARERISRHFNRSRQMASLVSIVRG